MNWIFHNVPESQAEESTRRVTDDIKLVLGIMKEIGVDYVEVASAVRLGLRNNNSSGDRLLWVQVSNVNVKRHILSNAKKLCNVKCDLLKEYIYYSRFIYQRKK